MIQLIINTSLLRELDERKLLNAYAHYFYESENDVDNEIKIKDNLIKLLDWDVNGDNGLGIYCSKFEEIKRKDWEILINFIKENYHEIRTIAIQEGYLKSRQLTHEKVIKDFIATKEAHNVERFSDENYTVSGRGKKARPCIYEGREYKSRQECIYKEGMTKHQLYEYLKNTNQL